MQVLSSLNRYKIFFIGFLIFLMGFKAAFAQKEDIKEYSGSYKVSDSIQGVANYQYYLKEKDIQLRHGLFSFQGKSDRSQNEFAQSDYKGKYEKGLKDGMWVYKNEKYAIEINGVNRDLSLNSSVRGSRSKLVASYSQGKAIGDWKYEEYRIYDDKPGKNINITNMSFSNGRLTGSFYFDGLINSNPAKIEGSFNKGHFFDGEWSFDYIKDSVRYLEKRVYDNGFLTYAYVKNHNNDSVLFDVTYDSVIEKLNSIKDTTINAGYIIDSKHFDILFDDGFSHSEPQIQSQLEGNKVLGKAFDRILNRNIMGLELEGILYMEPGGTRRFEYTFTEDEYKKLEGTEKLIKKYSSEISNLLNNPSLSINRQQSDSLAFAYRFLEKELSKLNLIKRNIDLIKSDDFKYQSLENYYKYGIKGLNKVDTIHTFYDGKDKFWYVENEVHITNGEDIIGKKYDLVRAIGDKYENLLPFLNASIKKINQNLQIKQLEEDMLKAIDSVKSLYSIVGKDSYKEENEEIANLRSEMVKNFIKITDTMLQEYSELGSFNTKEEKGKRVLKITNSYTSIYPEIRNLGLNLDNLDNAYTKYVDNKFLEEHSIRTRIKKNIYNAARERLIPFLIGQLKSSKDVGTIESAANHLKLTFERLSEISEMEKSETGGIERKLKRETDPKRIMEILEI